MKRDDLLAGLLIAGFIVLHGSALGTLQHNVDEGSNVFSARSIQEGKAPFRDFFYQQPPLYLYVLAVLPTDHFKYGRAVSLLAAAGAGWLSFVLARRMYGRDSRLPLLTLALFLSAGIQYYGLLAMPTSLMLAGSLLAVWILVRRPPGMGASATAGAVLALAVCAKPLALAVYPAAVVWLLVEGRRPQIVALTGGALAAGLFAWACFDLASGGAFSELVQLHAGRTGARSQVDALRQFPGMREWVGDLGPRGLSLRLHAETLLHPGNLGVGLFGLAGLVAMWRGATLATSWKWMWTLWLGASAALAFLVWDVAYHHYHMLYLPPLAVTGALAIGTLWTRLEGRRARRAGLATVCGVGMLLGVVSTQAQRQDYSQAIALRGETRAMMAFDSTVNVLSETPVGCGVYQFMLPPYGPVLSGGGASFDESIRVLIECLEADPSVRIVVHRLSVLSMVSIGPVLHRYILEQPEGRVIFLGEGDRDAFLAL